LTASNWLTPEGGPFAPSRSPVTAPAHSNQLVFVMKAAMAVFCKRTLKEFLIKEAYEKLYD